ncbi:MAG TPA: CHC2 zinc finger domain-containing protein [Conexibacter sp.]
MTDTILPYLQLLAGEEQHGALELRWRLGDTQTLRRRFYDVNDLDALAAAILEPPVSAGDEDEAAPTDVYIGCAPRRLRSNGRAAGGGRNAIERVWTLWVECDTAHAADTLGAFKPRPSAVIRSGSGANAHGYFALTVPVNADVAEDANRRLAAAIGGDPVCFDAARILRPPETLNHKHDPPRPVLAEWIEPNSRNPLSSWLANAPEISTATPTPALALAPVANARPGARRGGADPLLQILPAIYVAQLLRLDGIPRDCKVRCPFHTDERPSLHVYPTAARGWFCFSCRKGGSIYDLAARVLGYRTAGAEFLELRLELHRRFLSHLARTEACA